MSSQASTASNTSTIPPDIVDNQDIDFIDEINAVNDLFFGNIEPENGVHISYSDIESDTDTDSDDDMNGDRTSDTEKENVEIPISHSDVDTQEFSSLSQFKTNTCKCVRLYQKPCSTIINWDKLVEYRESCLEMCSAELDVLIKVQLYHHRKAGEFTDSKLHKTKEREKSRQEYFFNGKQVCRETFSFAHGVNRKKVDAIGRSLEIDGLAPRKHGNKGKSPKHAVKLLDVEAVKHFLNSYANKYGLPLPGRMPNQKRHSVLLPSDTTKAGVHDEFLTACESSEMRKVSLSKFKEIWLEQTPHIIIMKPATDLCHTCQSFVSSIQQSGNLTEEDKTLKLTQYQEHLDKAKTQRDHYRSQCDESKNVYLSLPEENKSRG